MRYRIIQTSDTSFIAQCAKSKLHALLGYWKGIDRVALCRVNLYLLWIDSKHQEIYCSVYNYAAAMDIIKAYEDYLNYKSETKKFPIYYEY